jgi:TRAP transporter TAXI family solute receptor
MRRQKRYEGCAVAGEKRTWRRVGAALAVAAALTAGGAAAAPAPPVALRAGKADGPYYGLAKALVAALGSFTTGAPPVALEESQGSVQNVIDAAGERARALFTAPPNVIKEARHGDKPYGKNPRYQDIRVLFPIPFQTMHWVVREDSGVKTFGDLAGRPFIPGTRGSLGERQTAALLKLLGIDTKVQLIDIDSNAAPAALKSKQVIGFAVAGPYPIPALRTLAGEVPLRLLSLTPEQRAQQLANDGTTVAMTIPHGTYPGIDEDVVTVALPAAVYTTTRLNSNDAYRITKAFWTVRAILARSDPAWASVAPTQLSMLGTKLHAGALRYYREAGIKIPAELR